MHEACKVKKGGKLKTKTRDMKKLSNLRELGAMLKCTDKFFLQVLAKGAFFGGKKYNTEN